MQQKNSYSLSNYTTMLKLNRDIYFWGSEVCGSVVRICYSVVRQPAQQLPRLILNGDGQPNAPASVNVD
jgi:hypothetical protein